MNNITQIVTSLIEGNALEKLTEFSGLDSEKAVAALSGALPVILQALAKNASTENGAEKLLGALKKDHDGSILENLSDFLSDPGNAAGAAILKHAFGSKLKSVTEQLSGIAGISPEASEKILSIVAPVVMAFLGSAVKNQNLNAAGLVSFIGDQISALEVKIPEAMGIFGKLLDSDGDGKLDEQVVSMGASLLSSLFKK